MLKEAVDSSLEHLRPWMPWARDEPQSLDSKVELLRRFRGDFDLGTNFVYGIFERDESEALGGTGFHLRVEDEGFEIGYWIRASARRRGLVTESTAALTRVAFEACGVDRVEIHVDPANEASLGVPRKLGFREEATLRRRLPPYEPGQQRRDETIFAMLAEDAAASPVAAVELTAYDAAGRPLTAI